MAKIKKSTKEQKEDIAKEIRYLELAIKHTRSIVDDIGNFGDDMFIRQEKRLKDRLVKIKAKK